MGLSFLLSFLVLVLVLGLVLGIAVWAIRQMTFMPPPVQSGAIAIICVIAIFVLLGALFGGVPLPFVVVQHR